MVGLLKPMILAVPDGQSLVKRRPRLSRLARRAVQCAAQVDVRPTFLLERLDPCDLVVIDHLDLGARPEAQGPGEEEVPHVGVSAFAGHDPEGVTPLVGLLPHDNRVVTGQAGQVVGDVLPLGVEAVDGGVFVRDEAVQGHRHIVDELPQPFL
jgi:hypothetical protein